MTESTERFDRDVASWLDEGTGRAPAPLIESILDETARTGQRPALIAVAFGAPTLRDPRRVGGLRLEGVVVLAVVALAALAAVLLAGSPRDWFDRLAVVPSASASADPRPSGSPIVETTPDPNRTPQVYTADVYTVTTRAGAKRWTSVSEPPAEQNGQHRVTFLYGSCTPADYFCGPPSVTIVTGPTGLPIAVASDDRGAPASITGTTVDEFAASWTATFGPTYVEKRDVSGWPAVIVTADRSANGPFNPRHIAAFIVTDSETLALTAGGLTPSRARLLEILDGLEVRHTPTSSYADTRSGLLIRSLDQPWTAALPAFMGPGPAPNGDPSHVAFWYGQCLDNLCPGGYVTVSSGTHQEGAVVEVRGSVADPRVIRVAGQSLADLKASWVSAFGPTTFESVLIDGLEGAIARWSDRSAALLVTTRGVVVIVASPPPFGAFDTGPLLRRFLDGVEFLPSSTGEYRNDALGFAVDSSSFFETWSGISQPEPTGGEAREVTFAFGSSARIAVQSTPITSTLLLGLSRAWDPLYASAGIGVDALASKWMSMPASAKVETITLSGWSGRLVASAQSGVEISGLFVVTGTRAFYIHCEGAGSTAKLRAFLGGFRLLEVS
jgi:hypothetical protein